MDGFPVKEGTVFKLGKDGALAEAPPKLAPIPEDSLPPDLRNMVDAAQPAPAPAESGQRTTQEAIAELEALTKHATNLKQAEEAAILAAISAEDKEAFVRAAIGNTPYTKTYNCFGDKVRIVLQTLTLAEYQATADAVVITSSRVPFANMQAIATAHFRISLGAAVKSITYIDNVNGSKEITFNSPLVQYKEPRSTTYYVKEADGNMTTKTAMLAPAPGQCMLWASEERFNHLSAPVFNTLVSIYRKFDDHVALMTKEAESPDFFL